MLTVRKRGKTWHADLLAGRVHVARGSLGTRNQDAARRLAHNLETALAEGAASPVWPELRTFLPPETFRRFAAFAGVKDQPLPMWSDLRKLFAVFAEQRVKIGKLAESTVEDMSTHSVSSESSCLSERLICSATLRSPSWKSSRFGASKESSRGNSPGERPALSWTSPYCIAYSRSQ